MTGSLLTNIVLLSNALWFGAGFLQFTMRSRKFAKALVPHDSRTHPSVEVIAGLVRFLGGLNLGLTVLALMSLLCHDTFASPSVLAACLLVFAVAHGSQFAVNVPMAVRESRGLVPLWPVLHGWMLIIFAGDGLLLLANGLLAARLW